MQTAFQIELKDDGSETQPDEFTAKLVELTKAVETKSADDAKLADRMAKLEARLNRPANDNHANDNQNLERKSLATFARTGSDVEMKSLTAGNDVGAGYLALPTVESGIRTLLRDTSPLRTLASTVTISGTSYEIIMDESDVESGWVNETQERPETGGPDLKPLSIPVHELYAAPKASQQILDDANIDLGAWLEGKIADRFVRVEGSAFSSGDGIGKPRGYLTYDTTPEKDFTRAYGKFQHVPAGATAPSDEQLADALVRLSLTLRTPYRGGASWLMSREAAIRIRQIKDSNKHFIWQPGLQDGSPDRLCGFPVAYDDNMAAIGTDTIPVALADWKQAYQIVDRHGIRFLRDNLTAKPHTIFYAYRRVGGAAVDFNALKFLKIAAA